MHKTALAFALCFVPRLIYLLWQPPGAEATSIYYWDLSGSLLEHGVLGFDGIRTTAYEPLYPLFLAAARWLTGDRFPLVMLLQIAVASAGAAYFYRLCLLLGGEERVAWFGVALYALYPYAIHQSARVIEVSLLTALLVVAAWHFCRIAGARGALAAGAAFGIALLARAAVLPVAAFAFALLAWQKRFLEAFCFAAAACLLVLPMALRNHQLDGSLLFSRSGENLFFGNNEYADKVIPAYNTDLLGSYVHAVAQREKPDLAKASEDDVDRYFRGKALEFVREQPLRALKLKLSNAAVFFDPRIVPRYPVGAESRLDYLPDGGVRAENIPPRDAAAETLQAAFCGTLFLAALAGAWLRRRELRRDAILYLSVLGFLLVCVVYFPATRLRAPVDFVPMFFAACALARWTRRA